MGNSERIIDGIEQNRLNVTSEMSIVGYPPKDLLHRDELYSEQQKAIDRISENINDGLVVLGAPRREHDFLYNSAIVVDSEGVRDVYSKSLLPNYDVFNESRYFQSDDDNLVFEYDGRKIGITICEDAWSDIMVSGIKRHDKNPILSYAEEDLDLMLNLSASPYRFGKPKERVDRFGQHAETLGCPVVFANQLGANDELIFEGGSFITDEDGVDYTKPSFQNGGIPDEETEDLANALRLGISDYFRKTGFEKSVIGMSGGIDSSVVATLASDALGARNVFGVSLPSHITSKRSVEDAQKVARRLGINFEVIDIGDVFDVSKSDISAQGYDTTGITSENLQARVRAVYLMAISNSMDSSLVITPDNKSETSVGYCTLYGDMVGSIAPIGDLYKQQVYKIAEYYNSGKSPKDQPLPQTVIEREPTAELKKNQLDNDSLPEYELLDSFLHQYINNSQAVDSIKSELTEEETDEVVSRIHASEFKRNQSPIVLRVSKKDLSAGWSYPIAADYDFLN